MFKVFVEDIEYKTVYELHFPEQEGSQEELVDLLCTSDALNAWIEN